MTVESFFDTNIFLYAGSRALEDAAKQQRAAQLIREVPFVISAQVLQEFISNALGKKALGFTMENVVATLEAFREVDVLPITWELLAKGLQIRIRYQVSYWDGAILAAAQELGCHTVYSEDMSAGQDYGGVRVVNPFVGL